MKNKIRMDEAFKKELNKFIKENEEVELNAEGYRGLPEFAKWLKSNYKKLMVEVNANGKDCFVSFKNPVVRGKLKLTADATFDIEQVFKVEVNAEDLLNDIEEYVYKNSFEVGDYEGHLRVYENSVTYTPFYYRNHSIERYYCCLREAFKCFRDDDVETAEDYMDRFVYILDLSGMIGEI